MLNKHVFTVNSWTFFFIFPPLLDLNYYELAATETKNVKKSDKKNLITTTIRTAKKK